MGSGCYVLKTQHICVHACALTSYPTRMAIHQNKPTIHPKPYLPSRRTQAPPVARFQPGKSILGPGGDEVVALRARVVEEALGDDGADL